MKYFYFPLILLTFLTCGQKEKEDDVSHPDSFEARLSDAALSIIDPEVVYTPGYVAITYPNGDVPAKTGVCTDVVIRTYRKLGIDLQKEVHEDLKVNFSQYPNLKKWGLKKNRHQY